MASVPHKMTQKELAQVAGCSLRTLRRIMEKEPEVAALWERRKVLERSALRDYQDPGDTLAIDDLIAAAVMTKGTKSRAAALLGCDRVTVHRYCKRYPEVGLAFAIADSVLLGDLEKALADRALDPEDPRSADLMKFLLQTRFKKDGYTFGLDISVSTKLVEDVDRAIRDLGQSPEEVLNAILAEALAEKRRAHLEVAQDATPALPAG